MKISFKIRQDLAWWGCSEGKLEPGEEHDFLDASEELVREVVAAEAAGSLTDVRLDSEAKEVAKGVVQSQFEGEKALIKAMGALDAEGRYTGPWMEGHLAQLELDSESGLTVEIGGGD